MAREAAMTTGCVEPDMRGVLPHSVGRHPVHSGHRLAIRLIAHSSFGLSQTLVGVVDHRLELGHGIAVRGSPQHQGFGQLVQIDRRGKVDVREATACADNAHQLAIQIKESPARVAPIEGSVQTEPRPHPFLNATNTNRCTLT